MEVLGRVFARRAVAAADMPTGEAEPEMYPALPDLKALRATVGRARLNPVNVSEVGTPRSHENLDLG